MYNLKVTITDNDGDMQLTEVSCKSHGICVSCSQQRLLLDDKTCFDCACDGTFS